jgi:hypothetical protein
MSRTLQRASRKASSWRSVVRSLGISLISTTVSKLLSLKPNWLMVVTVLSAGLIWWLGEFIYYLCIADRLPDSPRTLSHGNRRKLANHLKTTTPLGLKPTLLIFPAWHVRIPDAIEFSNSVAEAFKAGGWGARVFEEQYMDTAHYAGVWLGNQTGTPLIGDVAQDALREGGVKTRIVAESEPGPAGRMLYLLIGQNDEV